MIERAYLSSLLQYIIYFIIGGGIVTLVAYIASRGNLFLATLVGNIPILFLLNILLVYRESGANGSLVYAKSVLILIPVFVLFVTFTMLLLPRLGMAKAIMSALPLYLILPTVIYHIKRRRKLRSTGKYNRLFEVGQDMSASFDRHDYY